MECTTGYLSVLILKTREMIHETDLFENLGAGAT